MKHRNRGSRRKEILATLLDTGCREDFLKALLVDLPGKPAPHLLESCHAIRHSGAGPTLSPIDSLKNVGHAREARRPFDPFQRPQSRRVSAPSDPVQKPL